MIRTMSLIAYAIFICSIMLANIEADNSEHPLPPFSCDSENPSTKPFPFCNVDLPLHERAHDLVSRLSLDEKISQLVNTAPAVPRLGIPDYQWWSEALHGVAGSMVADSGITFGGSIRAATSFPQVILTAATFDENLWYRIAKAIGTEARAIYNEGEAQGMTFWSPNVNIFRDPRWGRGQETPGEDPFMTSKYAVSFVRGIQGDSFEGGQLKDGRLLASACCKHFTAYDLESWNGNSRFTFDARVTKQDMADTYQPPFKTCVKDGRASGIMCAYNSVNGVPNCADYDLLTKTARGEWGFQGYVVSDDHAIPHLFEMQKYSKSPEDAVADVLKAGLDVECGDYLANHTKSAVEKGIVSESDIDRALYNSFKIRMRLGLFNGNPSKLVYGNLSRNDVCSPEHHDLALEVARDGIVLLKNSANLLPLSKSETQSLAVIGPSANDSRTLVGNYAGPPCKTITPLQGLMNYVRKIEFHQGCETINCASIASIEAVKKLAQSADYVVLVVGINQDFEREDLDREDLVLPGQQQHLITSVAKAAKNPVILVLLCGGPVDISFAKNNPKIGGILWAGYPGEAGGKAIAEIIFGDHNPDARVIDQMVNSARIGENLGCMEFDLSNEFFSFFSSNSKPRTLEMPDSSLYSSIPKRTAPLISLPFSSSNSLSWSLCGSYQLQLYVMFVFPGGRLPVTWYPKDFIKIPMTDMRMRPDPSSGYPGRTYRFYQGEKVYEFGYGLSYSNYSYKFVSVGQSKLDMKLEKPGDISVSDIGFEACEKAKYSVIVSIENEGDMVGKNPVLLFAKRDEVVKGSPVKQLVGFQPVRLNAKEKANVEFEVNPCEHLSRASEDGTMVIESGAYHLIVGDQEYHMHSPRMFDSKLSQLF